MMLIVWVIYIYFFKDVRLYLNINSCVLYIYDLFFINTLNIHQMGFLKTFITLEKLKKLYLNFVFLKIPCGLQ